MTLAMKQHRSIRSTKKHSNSTSSTTDNNDNSLPTVQECASLIKKYANGKNNNTIELANLFTSCVAFLVHLDVDRVKIEYSIQHGDKLPSPECIPAVSTTLGDRDFFKALLAMLYMPVVSSQKQVPVKRPLNRKRSISHEAVDDQNPSTTAPSSKISKMMLSPTSSTKEFTKVPSTNTTSALDMRKQQSPLFQIPFPVLGASILYSALRYINQWPAILIKAYAEDSFGAQAWVMDQRCEVFVKNLAMCLEKDTEEDEVTNLEQVSSTKSFVKIFDEFFQDNDLVTTNGFKDTGKTPMPTTSSHIGKVTNLVAPSSLNKNSKKMSSGSALKFSGSQRENYKNKNGNDSSSSSGEEESEVVLDIEPSKSDINIGSISPLEKNEHDEKTNWWVLMLSDKSAQAPSEAYPRYIASNKELSHKMIGEALTNRLSATVKQNFNLLSSLPSFVKIPVVRELASEKLERWLQTPAVSLLAQPLFSSIVANVKNVDPPLPEDITAINSILSMSLNSGQFKTQIENVIGIVKSVPTFTIARHIMLFLLSEELKDFSIYEGMRNTYESSNYLKMFRAVLMTLQPDLAYHAFASSIYLLLSEGDRNHKNKLRILIRRVINILEDKYDGYFLVKSILDQNIEDLSGDNVQLAELSRIILECITMIIPQSEGNSFAHHRSISKQNRKALKRHNGDQIAEPDEKVTIMLRNVRKVVLKWLLSSYASSLGMKKTKKSKNINKRNNIDGAGKPIYSSILDGNTSIQYNVADNSKEATFQRTLRCLLFLVSPDSNEFQLFLQLQSEDDFIFNLKRNQARICCNYGVDVDNEILQIILESVKSREYVDPSVAISLIEQLLYHCRDKKHAIIQVDHSDVIWDLYSLTEFDSKQNGFTRMKGINHDSGDAHMEAVHDGNSNVETSKSTSYRLAYPGLWWRTTIIALVICGKSPHTIGAIMWNEHPTLRALIKMTTAEKYFFPTADCDQRQRECMKENENRLKNEEARITEFLFFPEFKISKKKARIKNDTTVNNNGSRRVSERHRARQEKLRADRQKKEAEEAMAEAHRRKRSIKIAKKSIMIWDPKGDARRPPRESVPLITSVNTLFSLAEAFQQCTNPDFLLKTIGSNSRDSIERAYDWLIPVVSSHPSIIQRLPPSASCYLLLRVFDVDSNENHQLLKLSSPLLKHVNQCVIGDFGEEDARRAIDILFIDIADENPDTRRCARRAMQESLDKVEHEETNKGSQLNTKEFSWLSALLHTKYSNVLAQSAVPKLSRALMYERGEVLRAYIVALQHYTKCGILTSSGLDWDFASTLCGLLSSRPHVCRTLIDRFPDIRDLILSVVHDEFLKSVTANSTMASKEVEMHVYKSYKANDNERIKFLIDLPILQSSILLISSWEDEILSVKSEDTSSVKNSNSKDALISLVRYLIPSSIDDLRQEDASVAGIASAAFVATGKGAVSIEEWVMLAKCRCDFIATHSALSAPYNFMPRLLLCCGLPRHALLSMLTRLGNLGDEASDCDKCFNELLTPSTTVQWNTGHASKRKFIKRKLLGRICANFNLLKSNETSDKLLEAAASSSFVSWLKRECSSTTYTLKQTKSRPKKNQNTPSPKKSNSLSQDLITPKAVDMAIASLVTSDDFGTKSDTLGIGDQMTTMKGIKYKNTYDYDEKIDIASFDINSVNASSHSELEPLLQALYSESIPKSVGGKHDLMQSHQLFVKVATQLLIRFHEKLEEVSNLSGTILKWIPILCEHPDEQFWKVFFLKHSERSQKLSDIMSLVATRTISSWGATSMTACQSWILKQVSAEDIQSYSVDLFLKCLVHRSGQVAVNATLFHDNTLTESFPIIDQQQNAIAAVNIAILGAHSWWLSGSTFRISGTERNIIPDWIILLLLIGKRSKNHLDLISKMLVDKLPSEGWEGDCLPGALLRLYLHFPSMMSLSDSKTRQMLISAVQRLTPIWLKWRTSLDEEIESTISIFATNPINKQQQLLCDAAKKYPLITIRHISHVITILRNDADASFYNEGEKRGRANWNPEKETALALIDSTLVKVRIIQWGHGFTESLWIGVLEMLAIIPEEVIFSCGVETGLLQVFDLYLKLFLVQHIPDSSAIQNPSITRTKTKFTVFVNRFQKSNSELYEKWLLCKIEGVSRHILLNSCGVKADSEVIKS